MSSRLLLLSSKLVLISMRMNLKLKNDDFRLAIDWLRYYYIWMDGPFEYLEPNFIDDSVKSYEREFEKTQKYYRNRIKQDMLGNPILKFRVFHPVGSV